LSITYLMLSNPTKWFAIFKLNCTLLTSF
jgi:hypothetical protein